MSGARPVGINMDLARDVAHELAAAGVTEVCLCAGARNSPLVTLLADDPHFRKYHCFEERSAAFFALGRIRSRGRAVAVVTTSGTAVAELLPAVIEAHYTGAPLILVSADRPRRYRGTGAPQAIEQAGLFGPYARACLDWEAGEANASLRETWSGDGPLHLNVGFDEPLLDRGLEPSDRIAPAAKTAAGTRDGTDPSELVEIAVRQVEAFLARSRAPLAVVGGLRPGVRDAVAEFLLEMQAPVYLEATSGLREDPRLQAISLVSSDRVLAPGAGDEPAFDGVLRIGGVPTLRLWRDLEGRYSELPLLSMSELPFAGTPRSELARAPLDLVCGALLDARGASRTSLFDAATSNVAVAERRERLFARDRAKASGLASLLEREPRSEPALVHALSRLIPGGARVYLGNSLPIREWDLAASREPRGFEVGANRGANGIDGQVSTFFGFCAPGADNWALLGDLTALYDLSAPWILDQLPESRCRLVVMNNRGGRIFSRMFQSPVFQNRHELDFQAWAAMWQLDYECWTAVPERLQRSGNTIIELQPDPDATARFWGGYDLLWEND